MSWISVGVGVGSAALGMNQQQQAQKQQHQQQKANMMANAAQAEFSPWTGVKPQQMMGQAPGTGADVLGAGLQSGLQGFMFGKQFGDKKKVPEKKPTIYSGLDKHHVPKVGPSNIQFPGQDPDKMYG